MTLSDIRYLTLSDTYPILIVIVLFGLFVAGTMTLVRRHHLHNMRSGPLPAIP